MKNSLLTGFITCVLFYSGIAFGYTPIDLGPPVREVAAGRGFDTLSAQSQQLCLETTRGVAPTWPVPSSTPISSQFISDEGNSYESLTSKLNMSLAVRASYGVYSGSVEASINNSYKRSSFSAWTRIGAEVVLSTQEIPLGTLRLNSVGEAAAKKGYDRFRRTCGDSFAAYINFGASASWVATVADYSEEEARSTSLQLKAAVNGATGSGSMDVKRLEEIDKLTKSHQGRIDVVLRGVKDAIPTDAASLVALIQKLPAIASSDRGAISYGWIPYEAIPAVASRLPWLDTNSEDQAAFDYLVRLIDRKLALEEVVQHPEGFGSVNQKRLQKEIQQLTTEKNRFTALLDKCLKGAPGDCGKLISAESAANTLIQIPWTKIEPVHALIVDPKNPAPQTVATAYIGDKIAVQMKDSWGHHNYDNPDVIVGPTDKGNLFTFRDLLSDKPFDSLPKGVPCAIPENSLLTWRPAVWEEIRRDNYIPSGQRPRVEWFRPIYWDDVVCTYPSPRISIDKSEARGQTQSWPRKSEQPDKWKLCSEGR